MVDETETEPKPDAHPVPISRIREVKAKYEIQLLNKANVVAVGIGIPLHKGRPAGAPGIIVSVTQKVNAQELAPEDLVPQELDKVPVWVEEIGHPRAEKDEKER